MTWYWTGDARLQRHRGWRCACIASTCHTKFPIPHLFCKSSCPNYVVVGMQVVHLDLVAVSSRTDRVVMLRGTSQSDKYVASDEIIRGTPANNRYAAML